MSAVVDRVLLREDGHAEIGAAPGWAAPLEHLSVVVPCHDEVAAIEGVVRRLLEVGGRVARRLEVIVVDDGSTDGTAALVAGLSDERPELRVVSHARRRGYGAALCTGFGVCTAPWVFYTDGDGQFELGELERAVEMLRDFDVVTGIRSPRHDRWLRRLNGRLWTRLVARLFELEVHDVNCAFKLLPRPLVERPLRASGGAASAEILARARRSGLRIGELPVRHVARASGRATGGELRVVLGALVDLARLAIATR